MTKMTRFHTVISVFLTVCCHLPTAQGQFGENVTQLLQDIIKVDRRARPVKNPFTTVEVYVSFHLMSIIGFDTVEQKLISNGWLYVTWMNEYTTWDPSDYGNVYLVTPDPDKVWRPMLTVQNTMKDLKPIGEEYIIIQTVFNGFTLWYPAERFETFCQVDVTYFPFDIQTCRWTLFLWGGDWANLTDLNPIYDYIELESYGVNGEWELMTTNAFREIHMINDTALVNLHYEVTLRRRPSLLALTVLLPVLVLAMVNVFVFTIPSEAGERLAYSMTALLSFGVFMSFILDSMPSSTETLSVVAVNLSCLLVLSAVYVLLCILSLRLFHRDSSKHPVSPGLQSLIVWLELLVCLDPPTRNKVSDVFQVSTDLLQTSDLGVLVQPGELGGDKKTNMLKNRLDKWAMKRKKDHSAYTDPAEMTWRRVSRTLDKLLFRFFFMVVIISNALVWTIMVVNYYQ